MTTDPQAIYSEVIKSFDLEEMPLELQENFLIQFGGMVYEAVMMRAAEEIPESQYAEFDELIASDPEIEQVFGFLETSIPHFETIVSEETARVKKDLDDRIKEYEEDLK